MLKNLNLVNLKFSLRPSSLYRSSFWFHARVLISVPKMAKRLFIKEFLSFSIVLFCFHLILMYESFQEKLHLWISEGGIKSGWHQNQIRIKLKIEIRCKHSLRPISIQMVTPFARDVSPGRTSAPPATEIPFWWRVKSVQNLVRSSAWPIR